MTAQQAKEITMQKNGFVGICQMIEEQAKIGKFHLNLSRFVGSPKLWERKLQYSQEDIDKLINRGFKVEASVSDNEVRHLISWK